MIDDDEDDSPGDDSDDSDLTPLESEAVEEQRRQSEAIARAVRDDDGHEH